MKSLKKLAVILLGLLLIVMVAAGCGGTEKASDDTDQKASTGEKPAETKSAATEGTLYLPGMGGHIAVAKVKIDPTNADSPITIDNLDRIKVGTPETNATHDIRIDQNTGIGYSSTIVRGSDGNARVDKIDLATMQVLKEVGIAPGDRYVGGPIYCASGQSENSFLPVLMGYEGFIDVINKDTLEQTHRVYFDDPKITKDYIFAHGVNTPDMKQFALVLNATSKEAAGQKPPRGNPDFLFFLLDMASLEQGRLVINQSGSIAADPSNSVAFRQTFTSDGKYLLQSGRDRALVVDGKTLELVRKVDIPKQNGVQIENHDIMPIPGDKYAILTLRTPITVEGAAEPVTDGAIQLMDVEKGELIGKPVSVCRACHDDYQSLKTKKAELCGIDAVWQK